MTALMTETGKSFKDSHKFTITADANFYEMISSGLYSDPIKAIVREYSTNAVDSHIEAHTRKAFDVHLPTHNDPYFWVRDYGTGLSNDDIKFVYCSYFNSTKRKNTKLTGKFGLGCKSALAYVSSMTVTSYFNGERTRWIVKLDEEGVPEILEEGSSSKTDQPNGIKVRFPVPPRDHDKFFVAAQTLYPFFDIQPNFVDCEAVINKPIYTLTHKGLKCNWGIKTNDKKSRLIMGGVAYDLVDKYNQFAIDLYVDNDMFEITPSRESLRYIDGAHQKITDLIEAATVEAHKLFDEQFGKQTWTNLYEKCLWFDSIAVADSSISTSWRDTIWHNLNAEISKWCDGRTIKINKSTSALTIKPNETLRQKRKNEIVNEKIKDGTYDKKLLDPKHKEDYHEYCRKEFYEFVNLRKLTINRAGNYKLKENDTIFTNPSTKPEYISILIHDVKNRLNDIADTYRDDTGHDVYLATIIEDEWLKDLEEFGLKFTIKNMSELPVPPREKVVKEKDPNHIPVPRAVGCFYWDESDERFRSQNDLTGIKYYVPLKDTTKLGGFSFTQKQCLDKLLKILKIKENEIIFIKEQYLDRYTEHFENFLNFVKKHFQNVLAKDKHLGEAIWLGQYATAYGTDYNFRRICDGLKEAAKKSDLTQQEIYTKALKFKLFEAWKPYQFNTLNEATNYFSDYYKVLEAFCSDKMLKPYEQRFKDKFITFRNQQPQLFYDEHQRIQMAFGLKITPFKKS